MFILIMTWVILAPSPRPVDAGSSVSQSVSQPTDCRAVSHRVQPGTPALLRVSFVDMDKPFARFVCGHLTNLHSFRLWKHRENPSLCWDIWSQAEKKYPQCWAFIQWPSSSKRSGPLQMSSWLISFPLPRFVCGYLQNLHNVRDSSQAEILAPCPIGNRTKILRNIQRARAPGVPNASVANIHPVVPGQFQGGCDL